MHSLRLKPVFCLTTIKNLYARALASNAAAPGVDSKPCSEIPGPSSLPIVGQLLHFLPGGEIFNSALDFGEKLCEKHGPIVKLNGYFGRPDFILLFDAESCGQVLRSENSLPSRPGFESIKYYRRSKTKNPAQPTGLITDDGDVWKRFRSTVNPIMLQPKTIQLYREMIDEIARDMISRMKSIRGNDNMLQGKFEVEMNLWSLESIGLVALGRRLNCLDPNLPADSPAKRLIQLVHETFIISNDLDFKPSLWRYYETRKFKKAMKLYEEHANITKYFIDKTIEELENQNERKNEDEKSVLEKLIAIDKEVAFIMASDMLFAGVDTTSLTITAALYLLANNQEKQNKLREELLSQREKRPYLKACLKESLRMIPVVPGNLRVATKDYNLLGYFLPKGTQLILMHQTMSLSESQYVRPKEYIPERWILGKDDPLYHGNAHPFAYNPFGFGVRSCIGRRIAELEMETFLGRIIENFRVEWFGPPIKGAYKIKSIKYEQCLGPKKRNASVMFLNIERNEQNKLVINGNVTFTFRIRLEKLYMTTWSYVNKSKTIFFNRSFDNPCQYYFIQSLFTNVYAGSKNCMLEKGFYPLKEYDLNYYGHLFIGDKFFYGTFIIKTVGLSKTHNIFCHVFEVNFVKVA